MAISTCRNSSWKHVSFIMVSIVENFTSFQSFSYCLHRQGNTKSLPIRGQGKELGVDHFTHLLSLWSGDVGGVTNGPTTDTQSEVPRCELMWTDEGTITVNCLLWTGSSLSSILMNLYIHICYIDELWSNQFGVPDKGGHYEWGWDGMRGCIPSLFSTFSLPFSRILKVFFWDF